MALQEKLDFAWYLIMQRLVEGPGSLVVEDHADEILLNTESSEQLVIANIPTSNFPMLEDA